MFFEKPALGIPRTLITMAGDYTKGILTRLGNRENSDGFCGELRMRIFILLRSNENFGDFTGEMRNENLQSAGE